MGEPVGFGEDGVPIYEAYRTPPTPPAAAAAGGGVSWWELMTHWDVVQADLQRLYHVAEWQVKDAPWPWFRSLIHDLVVNPESHIWALFNPHSQLV